MVRKPEFPPGPSLRVELEVEWWRGKGGTLVKGIGVSRGAYVVEKEERGEGSVARYVSGTAAG